MAETKKYRVLCNKNKATGTVFVDIAPEDNVIHNMIRYSRMRLTSSHQLEDCGTGSVYMTVVDGREPEIDFSHSDPGVDKPAEHQAYVEMCEKLRPLILKTYQRMIDSGRQSTLYYMMNPTEASLYQQSLNGNNQTAQLQKEAQSPQEEKDLQIRRDFYAQQERTKRCAAMQAAIRARRGGRTYYDGD